MSQDDPTPKATEPEGGNWKAPASQEELDSIVESRLARERKRYEGFDEYKAKAEKFDQAQQASKSDIEKATERAQKAEADLAASQQLALRSEIALTKGLTPTQAKRLVGSTREELEADADELLKDLGDQRPPAPRAPQQKTKQTSPKDDPERDFALRLFKRDA